MIGKEGKKKKKNEKKEKKRKKKKRMKKKQKKNKTLERMFSALDGNCPPPLLTRKSNLLDY